MMVKLTLDLMDQKNTMTHPRQIGRILAATIRSNRPDGATTVRALAEIGLDGDHHADHLSPRQVLLAGADAYARHGLVARALSENLLCDLDTASLRSGRLLKIGRQAVLWLSFQCEPCAQLDARQAGLSKRIGNQRGMLARVLQGGEIEPGDTVVELDTTLPAWSDDWRQRVARVLTSVPDGMVVDYKQLARLAGLSITYCRVFPKIARDLGMAHKAVSIHGRPEQPRWQGSELFDVY